MRHASISSPRMRFSTSCKTMSFVKMLVFPTSSPEDISPLLKLRELGYDKSQIIAVVGKTEGMISYNGQ
jgi:hypothetical protein